MSRIKPIKSVTFKGKKYNSATLLDKEFFNQEEHQVLFYIIFLMASGAYPTYLFSEIERKYGYQHELEIEASNHNAYKPYRINHPELWDYKVWKCLPAGSDTRFEKRLKYKRLEKLENIKPKV